MISADQCSFASPDVSSQKDGKMGEWESLFAMLVLPDPPGLLPLLPPPPWRWQWGRSRWDELSKRKVRFCLYLQLRYFIYHGCFFALIFIFKNIALKYLSQLLGSLVFPYVLCPRIVSFSSDPCPVPARCHCLLCCMPQKSPFWELYSLFLMHTLLLKY